MDNLEKYYNEVAEKLDAIGNKKFTIFYCLPELIEELEDMEKSANNRSYSNVKEYCYARKLREQIDSLKELREMLAIDLF